MVIFFPENQETLILVLIFKFQADHKYNISLNINGKPASL